MSYILNFKNWTRVYEAESTSTDKTTVTPLGTTGINVVTFGENTSFMAPDSKPYILLLAGSVQFQGFVNNQTIAVTLETNDFDKPGIYKNITSASTTGFNPTRIASGLTLDVRTTLDVMPQIVTALYGGVTKDRVMQTIKAMKIIKNDYATEIANNSLFTSLFKNCVAINNTGSVQSLYDLAGKYKSANMMEVWEGAKAAFSKT